MSQPVLGQLRQFLLAAALGGGLAAFSTLLRAVRLLRPRLTHLCDALFGLVLTPALLLLALYAGAGRFRLFFVPALALGAAVFALPLGKPAERLFTALFRLAGRFLRRMQRRIETAETEEEKKMLLRAVRCGIAALEGWEGRL